MPSLLELTYADPRAADLMGAQQRELRELYRDTDERTEPFDPRVLAGEGCALLGVGEGERLLACGALKRWDADTAEIKRMYVVPGARGQGLIRLRKIVWVSKLFFRAERVEGKTGLGGAEHIRVLSPDVRSKAQSRLSKPILRGLLEWARGFGYRRVVLETGDLQVPAIALYERSGLTRIPNFGYYEAIENSLCYELLL